MQPIAGHSLNQSSCDQQDFNASQKNAAAADQQQMDIENQSRAGYRCLAEGCNHAEIVANQLFNRHLPEMIMNNDVNHIRFRKEHLFAVTNGNSAERRKLYSLMQCYVFKPKGSRIWVLESSVEAKESSLIE